MVNRTKRDSAVEVFERLFPDQDVRDACASAMAESVQFAHAEAPNGWAVTLFKNVIRLNVGRIEVLAYFPGWVHCIVDSEQVPAAVEQWEDVELGVEPGGVLRSVPVSAVCNFPAELASEVLPLLRPCHNALIRAASGHQLHWNAQRAYSPAVIEFLSLAVGYQLQHPSYASLQEPGPSPLLEGEAHQRSLNVYERNLYAREKCIAHHGCRCSVCDFDFEAVFGKLGKGFIHVHHLKPLAEIQKKYRVDPIKDLRPICPNCHAMIHRCNPVMTIEKLRASIRKGFA